LSWSGWQGVAFSSNADIHPQWGFQPGFERFVSVNSQPPAGADDLRQRVVAFVERYADRPVFLYVHDNEPSAPHLPRNEPRARLDTPPAANPSEPPHEAGDEEEFGLARSLYRAEVQSASERFEAVLEALREVGRYEEALVVLVGAYGAEFGEHGGTRQGRTLLQEQLHVPLVIKPPAGSPIRGEVTDAVSLVDLFPTLLPLLGVAPPPYQAGRRLPLPGETAQNSAVVRSQLQLDRASAESVIFWPWKYLRLGSEVEHLYDLSADPGEQKDLRDAEPAILESMRRKLEQRTR
jgi:arylsulfatase A-like enzyme